MFKTYSLLLAKKEVSYGVDPVPVKATNAILTGPVDIQPVFKRMERLNVKQFLGNRPAISIGESVKMTFETEVKGSGDATPNTPPEIGPLFVGCGMLETINKASASVELTFAASADTATRATGSFITEGFEVGDVVTGSTPLNAGPFVVANVAALVLTFASGVADEVATGVLTAQKVVYTPQDDIEGPSITLYGYQHDHLYKVTGCRGTWSPELKAGEFSKIKWEFTGLYAGPTDDAMPADSTFNSTIPPAVKSASFALGSFAGVIENFKMAYGNEIAKRPSVNAATGFLAHYIKERKATAQIDPEAVALSSFDPIALLTEGTEQALAITVGTAAGNRMRINSAKVVVDGAKYAERENILTWDGSLLLCPSAGADDVKVTFN